MILMRLRLSFQLASRIRAAARDSGEPIGKSPGLGILFSGSPKLRSAL
jgi:hypothetical protein